LTKLKTQLEADLDLDNGDIDFLDSLHLFVFYGLHIKAEDFGIHRESRFWLFIQPCGILWYILSSYLDCVVFSVDAWSLVLLTLRRIQTTNPPERARGILNMIEGGGDHWMRRLKAQGTDSGRRILSEVVEDTLTEFYVISRFITKGRYSIAFAMYVLGNLRSFPILFSLGMSGLIDGVDEEGQALRRISFLDFVRVGGILPDSAESDQSGQ
jgi:hypothetical protein